MSLFGIGRRYYRPFRRGFSVLNRFVKGRRRASVIRMKFVRRKIFK